MLHKLLLIILTTLIYAAVIVPSVILTQTAAKYCDRRRYGEVFLISVGAVILPCVLAAFRGIEVGVDVQVYAEPVYRIALKTDSLWDLLNAGTRYEPGYLTIAYIAAKLVGSFHALLFLTQVLINVPVYIAVLKLRRFTPPWASMLCFYLFFYIETFNIMRQGIAVAFVFLGFAYLTEGDIKGTLIMTVIGELFHSTAVIGLALFLFLIYVGRTKSKKVRVGMILLITVAVPLAMKYWVQILLFVSGLGIIKARYANYAVYMVKTGYFSALFMLNYLEMLARWFGVAIPFIFARREDRSLRELAARLKNPFYHRQGIGDINYLLLLGTFVSAMIYSAVMVFLHSSYGYRVSFYIEMLFILWMPSLLKKDKRMSITNIPLRSAVMLGSALACFMILYMWRGVHGTRPLYFQLYDF